MLIKFDKICLIKQTPLNVQVNGPPQVKTEILPKNLVAYFDHTRIISIEEGEDRHRTVILIEQLGARVIDRPVKEVFAIIDHAMNAAAEYPIDPANDEG